jgi:hypothetical protein
MDQAELAEGGVEMMRDSESTSNSGLNSEQISSMWRLRNLSFFWHVIMEQWKEAILKELHLSLQIQKSNFLALSWSRNHTKGLVLIHWMLACWATPQGRLFESGTWIEGNWLVSQESGSHFLGAACTEPSTTLVLVTASLWGSPSPRTSYLKAPEIRTFG